MYDEYELLEIPLSLSSERQRVASFLERNGLRMDDLDMYVGVFDAEGELVAGGGLKGNVIKCVAVSRCARNTSLSNRLVTRLRSMALDAGYGDIFVFTKPSNEPLFASLAFHTVGRSERAVLMESDPRGVSSYSAMLKSRRKEGRNGVTVMNCNPFTKGHRHLIERAATAVENLYVIVVKEDLSEFSYTERLGMVRDGVSDIANVTVLEGSPYSVSSATFPSYFIKNAGDAADTQIGLDLDIFNRHIAGAIGASVRFVGSEPSDILTLRYNTLMKELLDIEVCEIPRLELDGMPVSASLVRRLCREGRASEAFRYVPETTIPYIIGHTAARCLREELELTPKPGLVDRHDNGSHKDMDFMLMDKSINTLRPFFTELAKAGYTEEQPDLQAVRAIGMRAEKSMFSATNGVNTHKGALFSIGLVSTAAAHCMKKRGSVHTENLQDTIQRMAAYIEPAGGTHGSEVRKRYNVGGAVECARDGYSMLFSRWLPLLRANREDKHRNHKLLLEIMGSIDDTNIYYRCGPDTAAEVKSLARSMADNFSTDIMKEANDIFISRNISPGGAADMLSLTLFIDSLCAAAPACSMAAAE